MRLPKEISPDAIAVLSAIPPDRVVATNDFAYDDRVERHLPLLNIWAPLASGRQFYASAFMFNFQHPDAADRLRVQRGDAAFLRTDAAPWNSAGWLRIAHRRSYEAWIRDRTPQNLSK